MRDIPGCGVKVHIHVLCRNAASCLHKHTHIVQLVRATGRAKAPAEKIQEILWTESVETKKKVRLAAVMVL